MFDELQPLDKRDATVNVLKGDVLPALKKADDWQGQIEAQNWLRSSFKYQNSHQIYSQQMNTTNTINALMKCCENLRSQVAKNGITAIKECFDNVVSAGGISE